MGIVSLNIKDRNTAEEVWALQHPAYRAEAALIGVLDLPPLQDTIQSLQSCGESFFGYRVPEGELAGAVSFEQEEELQYTLCRLMVHPKYFRKGIGGQLVNHLLSALPPAATCNVTAEIRNVPAIKLYERAGFVRTETFQPVFDITMVRMQHRP
jgi:ribosomal protein S18 acetylase RimI-like enzyme